VAALQSRSQLLLQAGRDRAAAAGQRADHYALDRIQIIDDGPRDVP
jgi:hypothetical protein